MAIRDTQAAFAATPRAIAHVHRGFVRGGAAETAEVGRWIRSIVHGGNWRFADADGVAQEVLVRLFETARAGKVDDPSRFKKFVFTVARYTCTEVYYRERRRPDRPGVEPDEACVPGDADPHADLERDERLDAMVYVYQRLPEPCRRLWNLVYGEGLSQTAAADRLEITVNNVRVRMHRCLARAREIADRVGRRPEESAS